MSEQAAGELPSAEAPPVPLSTIAREWGRIGCIGFGGPPAHIVLLRTLCVEDRQWLPPSDFEDGLAACNLLPGPASTQLAIFCAWRLRGAAGAILGGVCFIVPGLVDHPRAGGPVPGPPSAGLDRRRRRRGGRGRACGGRGRCGGPDPGELAAGRCIPGWPVPGRWLPGRWLPGRWLPGRWLPGRWLPGRWLPGRWRRRCWRPRQS